MLYFIKKNNLFNNLKIILDKNLKFYISSYKNIHKHTATGTIITNGSQVFTNPQNPTYFPNRNIHAASLTVPQCVLPPYFTKLNAIPQKVWQLNQTRLWICFEYAVDDFSTASSQAVMPPSNFLMSSWM